MEKVTSQASHGLRSEVHMMLFLLAAEECKPHKAPRCVPSSYEYITVHSAQAECGFSHQPGSLSCGSGVVAADWWGVGLRVPVRMGHSSSLSR